MKVKLDAAIIILSLSFLHAMIRVYLYATNKHEFPIYALGSFFMGLGIILYSRPLRLEINEPRRLKLTFPVSSTFSAPAA